MSKRWSLSTLSVREFIDIALLDEKCIAAFDVKTIGEDDNNTKRTSHHTTMNVSDE